MKRIYTKEEKQGHVEKWKEGTLSKAAYAKTAGLSKQTFYTWAKGVANEGEGGFVEISAQIKQEQTQRIIIERGEIKIHVPMDVWEKSSKAVMDGLRAVL